MTVIDACEAVVGDYILEVHGVSDQINRIESLENMVQFMNIVGQNETWAPYINQTEMFKRILENFPNIRDIDRLVNDPETVEAQRIALEQSQLTPEIIRTIPGLMRSYAELARAGMIDTVIPQAAAQTEQTLEERAKIEQQQQELQAVKAKQQLEISDLTFEAEKAQLRRVIKGEATLDGFSEKPKPAGKEN